MKSTDPNFRKMRQHMSQLLGSSLAGGLLKIPKQYHSTEFVSKPRDLLTTEPSMSSVNLQSLIRECSFLQTSVGMLKSSASNKLTDSKLIYSQLNQASMLSTAQSRFSNEVYRRGKQVIEAKKRTKQNHSEQKRQVDLVKSLVLLNDDGGIPHPLPISSKDLKAKQTLQLLALNRRKFGERRPSDLKLPESKAGKAALDKTNSLEESIKQDISAYQKKPRTIMSSASVTPARSPPKLRHLMVEEQEELFEQMERMTNLNRLVLCRSLKYKANYRSKLNYKHNLDEAKRLEQVKPISEVTTRATSRRQFRLSDKLKRIEQLSKTLTLDSSMEHQGRLDFSANSREERRKESLALCRVATIRPAII
jgi:hypothetical protein